MINCPKLLLPTKPASAIRKSVLLQIVLSRTSGGSMLTRTVDDPQTFYIVIGYSISLPLNELE